MTMIRRNAVLTLAMTVTGLLAACASDPGPGEDGRGPRFGHAVGDESPDGRDGPEGRHRGPGLNTFISPMGEPFRAPPGAPYAVVQWFADADADHDGRLTQAEFIADADRFFERLDANHDGVIDGFEIADYERVIAPEILPQIESLRPGEGMDMSLGRRDGGRSRGRGPEGGGERPGREQASDVARKGGGAFGLFGDPEPVASASLELNGRVSRADWRATAAHRFQRLDATGKGWIGLSELPPTPIQVIYERQMKARQGRKPADHGAPGGKDGPPPGA